MAIRYFGHYRDIQQVSSALAAVPLLRRALDRLSVPVSVKPGDAGPAAASGIEARFADPGGADTPHRSALHFARIDVEPRAVAAGAAAANTSIGQAMQAGLARATADLLWEHVPESLREEAWLTAAADGAAFLGLARRLASRGNAAASAVCGWADQWHSGVRPPLRAPGVEAECAAWIHLAAPGAPPWRSAGYWEAAAGAALADQAAAAGGQEPGGALRRAVGAETLAAHIRQASGGTGTRPSFPRRMLDATVQGIEDHATGARAAFHCLMRSIDHASARRASDLDGAVALVFATRSKDARVSAAAEALIGWADNLTDPCERPATACWADGYRPVRGRKLINGHVARLIGVVAHAHLVASVGAGALPGTMRKAADHIIHVLAVNKGVCPAPASDLHDLMGRLGANPLLGHIVAAVAEAGFSASATEWTMLRTRFGESGTCRVRTTGIRDLAWSAGTAVTVIAGAVADAVSTPHMPPQTAHDGERHVRLATDGLASGTAGQASDVLGMMYGQARFPPRIGADGAMLPPGAWPALAAGRITCIAENSRTGDSEAFAALAQSLPLARDRMRGVYDRAMEPMDPKAVVDASGAVRGVSAALAAYRGTGTGLGVLNSQLTALQTAMANLPPVVRKLSAQSTAAIVSAYLGHGERLPDPASAEAGDADGIIGFLESTVAASAGFRGAEQCSRTAAAWRGLSRRHAMSIPVPAAAGEARALAT
jgi:hypothetical protein